MEELIKDIKKRSADYGPIPFWSWNDKLEEGELREQIRTMKKLNMGGFFMHARGGLETEYLSDDWFNCINVCIDEAKKLGMEAWSYDENGWPSGFAGGKLLEDKANFAVCIRYEITDKYPAIDSDTIAVYTKNKDGSFTIVDHDCGADEYLKLYKGYDSSYVDTLDGSITDKFLAETHEVYLKKIAAEDAGTVMPGFFTDEPQYYRWDNPYSNTLPAEFKKAYGYDIFPLLPAVFFDFDGAEKFRYDYYKLMHELFINNFVKKIYDWCNAHGMKLTGHAVEETSLDGQMMCCGGVMPFYEYEHIPGIDYLGRGISDDIAPKQLDSVCEQLGKKKAISEMFGCCGWDVTPTELKRIADVQYVNGVNLMCAHLAPYSERGQRKRDYPNHYSYHNPWQSHLAQFDEYFKNLGTALTEGKEYAPILVIHPMHGAYMKYKKKPGTLSEIEGKFFELSRLLGYNQVPYHYGDENMMKVHASVENGKIKVGNCVYEAVIIPFTYTLDESTAELLKKFISEGGKVWCFGYPDCINGEKADMTWLHDTCTKEDIFGLRDAELTLASGNNAPQLRKMTRITDGGKIIYITNITSETLTGVKVKLDKSYLTQGSAVELNPETLEIKPLCGKLTSSGAELTLNFEEGQSYLIIPSDIPFTSDDINPESIPFITLPDVMKIAEKPTNMINLDMAELSFDGKTFDESLSVMGIKDNLLRQKYDGDVWLRFHFNASEEYIKAGKNLQISVEPMNVKEICVNGNVVHALPDTWWFDKTFMVYDILKYAKAGDNEITIKLHHWQRDYVYYVLYSGVSESLRNCLVFDCEIEDIYLIGDFCVKCDGTFTDGERRSDLFDGKFSIEPQRDDIHISDIVKDGYPFYAGHFKSSFVYDYTSGMPTLLKLTGRYAVCDVTVNGTPAGTIMFSDYLDLSPYIKDGKNEITLDMCNSNRNLMGPHHRHDPEPYGVGPNTFSYEKEWNGRECKGYVDRYAFVRYGLDTGKNQK